MALEEDGGSTPPEDGAAKDDDEAAVLEGPDGPDDDVTGPEATDDVVDAGVLAEWPDEEACPEGDPVLPDAGDAEELPEVPSPEVAPADAPPLLDVLSSSSPGGPAEHALATPTVRTATQRPSCCGFMRTP